jgi:hypothetical protein
MNQLPERLRLFVDGVFLGTFTMDICPDTRLPYLFRFIKSVYGDDSPVLKSSGSDRHYTTRGT